MRVSASAYRTQLVILVLTYIFCLYLSSEVARDNIFPFKHGDDVIVKIDVENRQLIIKKSEELEHEAREDSGRKAS